MFSKSACGFGIRIRGTRTHSVRISSSFKGFDIEVDGACEGICESISLNYLDEFHTNIFRGQRFHLYIAV